MFGSFKNNPSTFCGATSLDIQCIGVRKGIGEDFLRPSNKVGLGVEMGEATEAGNWLDKGRSETVSVAAEYGTDAVAN